LTEQIGRFASAVLPRLAPDDAVRVVDDIL
jgi:hypothetical protein